jgi:hypothetical protein
LREFLYACCFISRFQAVNKLHFETDKIWNGD